MIVEGIQCPRCKEHLWSKYRHDFHYCSCGYCFVDGGRDYLRYGWGVKVDKLNDDGSITVEEWAVIAAENARIGKPEPVSIEVPDPPPQPVRKSEEWPYPGWIGLYLANEIAALNNSAAKKKTRRKKSDELPKPRNRVKASSVRPKSARSKRSPSKPVRQGKNKATVRK